MMSNEEVAKDITVALVSRMAEYSMDKFFEKSRDAGQCAAEVYKAVLQAITEEKKARESR